MSSWGKEEPQVEFPWINEAAALEKKMTGTVILRLQEAGAKLLWPLLGVLAVAIAAYFSIL